MSRELKKQIEILNDAVLREDFLEMAYEVIDEIEAYAKSFDAVEPILRIMEQNPNIDFGSPGPLVHFVEQFYGKEYEEKLVQSIQRFPTSHTVWMLNRIINGSKGEQKKYYLAVLQNILKSPNISNELRAKTIEFLYLHK